MSRASRALLAVLVAPTGYLEDVIRIGRQHIFAPIGRIFDRLMAPVDRAFEPLAERFNDNLGKYFGEVTGLQLAFLLLSILVLLTGGYWGKYLMYPNDMRRSLAFASIFAIFAMGWDIQSGYTGYISFGHSMLSGAAAYTVALLLVRVNPEMSYLVMTPIAVAVALAVGLLIALPSLRLEGPYFSLITFVGVLLFYRLTIAYSEVLGGETGFQQPNYLVSPADPFMRYYVMLIPMLVIALVLTFLARSNLGLILTAIRENESAVSAAGINPTKFKIWSFVISSIPMGIGGVLLVGFAGNVDPVTFIVVDNSIEMIAVAVVGGMSSILGPLGGAFLFEILNHEVLGLFVESTSLRYFFLFIFVIIVLVVAQEGLFRRLWHRLAAVRGEDR